MKFNGDEKESKNPLEKVRIKAQKFLSSDVFREDVGRGFTKSGEHLFYRLSMPFEEALDVYEKLEYKIDQSPILDSITIRNLSHPEDTQEFMFLYNAIFIAAPDPSRTITIKEAKSFPEQRTFIASIWNIFAGFIYLSIEDDPLGSGDKVGAIAGVGVLPKYRGKKLGLLLIKHAIDFFRDKGIKQLICEVYHENAPSLNMFKNLGMEIVGKMILEDVQPEGEWGHG